MKNDGAVIILAFPDAYVSTTVNGWYNNLLEMSGISQFGKVCAGHAAMVLVDKCSGKLHYADFGRYITAPGYGRARIEKTDPEVVLDMEARLGQNGKLKNLADILLYLEENPEKTHGEGRMFATLSDRVDFEEAFQFMDNLNGKGGVPYGPFVYGGSNCSRFVADVVKASTTVKKIKRKFGNPLELTTSPLGNVSKGKMPGDEVWLTYNGEHKRFDGSILGETRRCFFGKSAVQTLKLPVSTVGTLEKPECKTIPAHAQWLGGTGAGAWFVLDAHPALKSSEYRIRRFDAGDHLIFDRVFIAGNVAFDLRKPYEFTYDSNAHWCTIGQEGKLYRFTFSRVFGMG